MMSYCVDVIPRSRRSDRPDSTEGSRTTVVGVGVARASALGVDSVLAIGLAVGVLVQAVLAGQSNRLFGTVGIGVHAAVGNVVFMVAVVQLALVVIGHRSRHRVVVVAGFVVGLVVQIGLGYAAREVHGAAAWHVPLGVALFGLSVWNLALALQVVPERPTSTP